MIVGSEWQDEILRAVQSTASAYVAAGLISFCSSLCGSKAKSCLD